MTGHEKDELVEETDNSPRPEDGDQSVVSQRPETLVLEEDLAGDDVLDLTSTQQHEESR